MNQTRKEIIGWIEPYMDNTLSEGCIYYRWETDMSWDYHTNSELYKEDDKMKGKRFFIKILWHYDITAVEKFILSNWGKIDSTFDINFKWFNIWKFEMSKANISIPNKPLHLYTEQEDKNLLEILKKLN